MDQCYCTVAELMQDMELEGVRNQSESRIVDKILAASKVIERRFGNFIPMSEARRFDGNGLQEIYAHPLLAVTSIVDDTTTLGATDYLLYPRNRLWHNGPYIRIGIDPDSATVYNWSLEKDIVVITGKWGMYEETKATGAFVASQTDSAISLAVDNAAGISVGAILLIESEQEAVTAVGAPSDSTANTNGAIDLDDEVIVVTDGSKVSIGEVIRIDFEQMLVLDVSGNNLLVTRGWNRTSRVTHLTGLDVYVYRTFTVERARNGTVAAAHTAKAISRYVVPSDILWLTKQMAGVMLKKADSGFAGKVGNSESGETFYFNEFPKAVIDVIEQNYFIPMLFGD